MAETALSPAVQLVWQIAGDLAQRSGAPFIEPAHLLYGVCSLEKVVASESKNWLRNPSDESPVRNESDRLSEMAREDSVDLAAARKTLRDSVSSKQQPGEATSGRVVSRSPAAKQIFDNAAAIAQATDAAAIDVLALLRALLESGDAEIAAAPFPESFRDALRGLPQGEHLLGFVTSSDSRLTDLDQNPELAHQPVQITESLDAAAPVKAGKASGREAQPWMSQPSLDTDAAKTEGVSGSERLAWLSEFAWEFGTQGQLELLLQRASDELLRMLPTAERDVILVRDAADNELLLKAYSPQTASPRVSMTSVKRAMEDKKGFVWRRGEDLTLSQKESSVETGVYVPLVVNGRSIGAICLDSTVPAQCFGCDDLEIITCLAHQLALAIANHELRATLKQNADVLERLLTNFSPKVRTRLLQRAKMGRLALGGEHSVVSILCSDIRGFTQLSAGMSAEDVVALLNEYFAALVDCIFRHDGTVDKFVGDAILAVFGSPEADPQHHRKAVMAAVEMQEVMQQVSQRRAARGEVTCQIGIGVHSGEVLHGFIGSPDCMEFTVIGDAVNLAARYSDGAKGSEILISPEVHQRVWRMTSAEKVSIATKHEGELSAYRVKGISAPPDN